MRFLIFRERERKGESTGNSISSAFLFEILKKKKRADIIL